MERLKIGVICYPSLGGSGVVATELAIKMAARGHEIHFITSSLPFRYNEPHENIHFHEVRIDGYAVFKYPPYDIALANRIGQVVEEQQLDLLHVHYAVPHAVSAVLAKDMIQSDIGIITTLHGTDVTILGHDPALRNTVKYGIDKSDITTAVSESLRKETIELIEPAKDILTIYNFIDEEKYHPVESGTLRGDLGIQQDEKVIIHISNFRSVKRIPDLIRAFAQVTEKLPAKLLLVGEGPEMPRIRRLVDMLGVTDHVLFTGRRDDLPELLSFSDVMVLPSEKEAFGLVLLEAFACGVPAVGTTAGGIPEVIEEGMNGHIVPIGDPDAIAEKTLRILSDSVLHQKMKEQAMESVKGKFASDTIVAQYEKLYYDLQKKEC
ncbi:N-acetyl-alpha-D-glucosaminyl L-malate synthase BshA [Sporosarcina gallistercoris]|uniref:N-acetyl-alpha-D-glucosaminyl L-malate synthase BshA n=1 Tax=Sporosarcina gallistercoris TaxID=2762245 RepID=A0ABR8PFJ4_9BACL|nr:N-acetyl-alpha-D-glucosaminyl L-malate synthase BshA [Sporosarcina gallistercoris]MBD7906937.1 N-acetyl-alpha-D-glucosaminyl L-malate synthase BshA [Sporosarcina gallistercoris]